jgi:hypothetical protein
MFDLISLKELNELKIRAALKKKSKKVQKVKKKTKKKPL